MALSLSGDGTLSGVDIAASGLGRVLQVVRATDGTNRTATSTSFVDAGISITITPTKSTSAIVLIWTSYASPTSGSSNSQAQQIADSSNTAISGAEGVDVGTNNSATTYAAVTLVGYATPATTSAVTYKGRYRMTGAGATARLQNGSTTGQMLALEIGA
jgi:hypothetical protein